MEWHGKKYIYVLPPLEEFDIALGDLPKMDMSRAAFGFFHPIERIQGLRTTDPTFKKAIMDRVVYLAGMGLCKSNATGWSCF